MTAPHVKATLLLHVASAVAACSPSTAVPTPPTRSPIQIGGQYAAVNVPYVTVTVCVPGTDVCQTVDQIKLDTGSTGLRVNASALRINLPMEDDGSGHGVAQCMQSGSSHFYWGSLQNADLTMGGETAANVPIHVIDQDFASLPASCTPSKRSDNGLLGVGTARYDKQDSMYLCSGSSCAPSSSVAAGQRAQNPIARMPTNNNGFTITFPSVGVAGTSDVTGALVLGVGTNGANSPGADVSNLSTDEYGHFRATANGGAYESFIDSGTASWNLPTPVAMRMPSCSASRGWLCPTAPVTLALTLVSSDGTNPVQVGLGLDNADQLLSSGARALSNLGTDAGADYLGLGMPFFFGRTVFFVIEGSSSVLGSGPRIAFGG